MKPTTLEVMGADDETAYSGPVVPLVQLEGQKVAYSTLMYLYFDPSQVTQEDLTSLFNASTRTGIVVDDIAVNAEEAYIGLLTAIDAGPYEFAFAGNEKFAPFAVKVVFNE